MARSKPNTDAVSAPPQAKPRKQRVTAVAQTAPEVSQPYPVSSSPELESAEDFAGDWASLHRRLPRPVRWSAWAVVFVAGLFAAVSFAYTGKAYPGVSVDGIDISGMSHDAAVTAVNHHLSDIKGQLIPISYGDSTVQLDPAKLEVQYDVGKAVTAAINYGRNGSWGHQLYEQARALAGRSTNVAYFSFNDTTLRPYLNQISGDTDTPMTNAALNFSGNSVTVNASSPGRRLNAGYLILQIENRLAASNAAPITAPVGDIAPTIDTESLEAVKSQATAYVSSDLMINSLAGTTLVPQDQIVSWVKVSRPTAKTFDQTQNVANYYTTPLPVSLSLDDAAIASFVAGLAGNIDRTGQNALLAMNNGQLQIIQASKTGQQLDQPGTVTAIKDILSKNDTNRALTLNVKVTKPDVNEDNLASLGIKEQISEGATTFPGSIPDRITNIRVGTSKFNSVLIKPGENFSFDSYLGDIDGAHGWKPGLAIVGNKIEPQYGGGICQVSSTMYRAALLAGLPITQRVNHAYAISWYTAPYGVPGVDATIYSPSVDLRFVNDTGSWILIQPNLDVAHSSLKFDFFGTKTKSGQIRGPVFVSGSNDVTQPSTTVFYRDVLDMAGNVTKTDTVTTHYASSLDFTHVTTPGLD